MDGWMYGWRVELMALAMAIAIAMAKSHHCS
jgi:hypothetical protein